MSRKLSGAAMLAVMLAPSCGGAAPERAAPVDGARPAADAAGAAVDGAVKSGNPYDHGLTDADFPRVRELADGVYSYEQIHSAGGEVITTVSMFVVTPAGVLVADGQESVEETRRLVDTIARVTDRPITHVVICSDHGDHSAGNSAFPADATFLAHPTSAETLAASVGADRPAGAPPVVLPTELVDPELVLVLGGREIRVLHLGPAHTGGDLVVYVPDGKVLFMSETFLHRIFPAMRSAHPSGWVAMIERAQALDVDVYVPGHGLVQEPALLEEELETFRRAMATVIAEATRLHAAGVSVDDAPARADFGDLADWTLSASQIPRAIGRVYMELNGELDG